MDEKVKIIVACHKPCMVIKNDVYMPVQVGAVLSDIKLDMQGDDTGDNISSLNPIYCEMTAAYWAWKNLKEKPDYIGLCHYRRYFTMSELPKSMVVKGYMKYLWQSTLGRLFHPEDNYTNIRQIYVYEKSDFVAQADYFAQVVPKMFQNGDYDIIVPTKHKFSSFSVETFFARITGKHIMDVLDGVISEMYPEYYVFYRKSLVQTSIYPGNMFIMKWRLYEDYCKMCFDILHRHRLKIIEEGWCLNPVRETCFARMAGYLFEILTSAYMEMLIDKGCKFKTVNTLLYFEK